MRSAALRASALPLRTENKKVALSLERATFLPVSNCLEFFFQ